MQPPRPFHGVPYDKDMFTFLPAPANRDVLVESPRKRKSMASDNHTTIATPTMGYDPYGKLSPKENGRDLHGGQQGRFIPASSPRESTSFRIQSDSAKFGHQNDCGAPWHSPRGFYNSESVSRGHPSFAGQFQSSNYNDSPSLIQSSPGLTYDTSNWSPLVTKDFNQHGSPGSNARVGGEEKSFHFPKTPSYGVQMPTLTKTEGSEPGAYVVGSNEDHPHEHSYKAESFTKIEGLCDSSSFKRVDPTKMLGNNVGISMHNLGEANRILQQALRLISASSGTNLTVNQDVSNQGSGGDITKIKSTPNSQTQNLSHSSIDDTPSKGIEADLHLDKSISSKPISSDDKGSINVGDALKSEYGGLALAEKLWDGTLQLSYSVSVSAVAFFKSGERMHDFSWPGSVEVRGKVKLEAFEKYVQDLPRSRTRGLMVMSLWGKEGSSSANHKSMTEVARKYREGKKVGFAQLNKGLDMYICPHSDSVITILAKHGFFKGMTAVAEKSDTLIGCVVWRKNASSLSKQSDGNSDKIQTEIERGKNGPVNKSPEFCVDQPEQSIPENKQPSEINSYMETIKPNLLLPSVPNQSLVLSDDEDLPEFDFGAEISQTFESKSSVTMTVSPTPEMELVTASQVNQSISDQKRSESFTVSQTLPGPRFQGLPHNMKHQPEAHNPNIQLQQEKQSGETKIGSRTSTQGLDPRYMGNQHEKTTPNWPIEEKKPVDDCTVTVKPKNIFDDDDDMPEWCPPDFKKTTPEVNERPGPRPGPGPGPGPGPSMIPRFSFTDLATGRQLPSPPPLPPLPPPPPPPSIAQVQPPNKTHPTENRPSLPLPPPPPPRPPPPPPPLSTQGQFFDKNYPPVPQFPNPAIMHESPNANKTSMHHYSAPSQSPLMQFQTKQYPPPGHLPRPPPPLPPTPPPPLNRPNFPDNNHSASHFSNQAVNNFMNNRPGAPSRYVRFQDQHYPPAPPLPLGRPETSNSNNFTPNSDFRPQFHGPGTNNQAHPSAWRGSRP